MSGGKWNEGIFCDNHPDRYYVSLSPKSKLCKECTMKELENEH